MRRRRTLVVAAVVAVILGTIYGVTQAEGERESTRVFLDLTFDVAGDGADAAAMFADLVINVNDYNRAALLERLDTLESEAEDLVERVSQSEPPGSLIEAGFFLRIATTTWRSGISEARVGLIALSSNPLDEDGLEALTSGLIDLRVGDSAYVGFISGLGEVDTSLQGGAPPAVVFVPAETESFF